MLTRNIRHWLSRHKVITVIGLTVLAVLLVIIAFLILLIIVGVYPRRTATVWFDGSPKPLDRDRFRLVMFPKNGNADVQCPESNISSLQRAVLVTLEELDSETIEVFVGNSRCSVRKNELIPLSNTQRATAEIAALNRELKVWGGETFWSNIQYEQSIVSADRVRVVVQVTTKRHYVY